MSKGKEESFVIRREYHFTHIKLLISEENIIYVTDKSEKYATAGIWKQYSSVRLNMRVTYD